jgi:transposase
LALQTWLQEERVTHVAMEATGAYWKPVYNLLEASFTSGVVNPAHMKNVPGRKTDIKDAAWIADLLRHGLLTPSFIPDKPQRELRELTRQRTPWLAERARDINRVQKVLEGAHIKLASGRDRRPRCARARHVGPPGGGGNRFGSVGGPCGRTVADEI